MDVLTVEGVSIVGVVTCVPPTCVGNLEVCTAVYGDTAKAASVVKATGIKRRRVV